ncbi:MAG: hypothetical protein NC218_11475 [Acetobacter sp.]|nr:hypothetical protein [Acetobacter sp.]
MKEYQAQFLCKSIGEDTAAEVKEKLAALGISIRNEDGTLKNLYNIMDELCEKWYIAAQKEKLDNMADIEDVIEWN